MHFTILALATAASLASAQSSTSASASASQTPMGATVGLGENCVPGGTPCALGAGCYAVNSMLQTVCGNFQAECTSDQQCAFNTCNKEDGLCNGFLPSASASASASPSASATITSSSSAADGYRPAPPSTVTAPAGSLPLGAECNALASLSQCQQGVQCWASNAGLIARCGNFNAACQNDAQCAYNTCNNGICSGFLPSSAFNVTSSARSTGGSAGGSTGGSKTTGGPSATTMPVQYTGAAAVANVAGGVAAAALGAVAWVL